MNGWKDDHLIMLEIMHTDRSIEQWLIIIARYNNSNIYTIKQPFQHPFEL